MEATSSDIEINLYLSSEQHVVSYLQSVNFHILREL